MGRYVLRITDGTDAIDIGHEDINGISLDDGYLFGLPQPKDGGVFQNSSLAEGQRLSYLRLDDIEAVYPIAISGSDQDEIIYTLSELFRLLQKANDYWLTSWQNEPVWIERRSRCETGTQYTTIKYWQVDDLPNVYSEPFDTANKLYRLNFFDLLIRHEIWRGHEPGEGDCIVYQDGRPNVTLSTCDEVFLANKTNQEVDIDIYYWDDSASTWTEVLVGPGNPPQAILPASPAVDDIILIGIDSTNTFPLFSSVVFNIDTAQTGLQFQWKYSRLGGDPFVNWMNLSKYRDNTFGSTASFQNTGQKSIHFEQPGNWAKTPANPGVAVGVNTYWIAAIVTVAAAGSTPPYIDGEISPYTLSWPYVEIFADQLNGSLPASLWHIIKDMSYGPSPDGVEMGAERLIFGSRSVSRGPDFNAFINVSDEQQPDNITVLASGSATLPTTPQSITGTMGLITATNAIFEIIIEDPLSLEYIGVFRLFLRMSRVLASSGTVDVTVEFNLNDDDRNIFHTVTRKFESGIGIFDIKPFAFDFGLVGILQDINIASTANVAPIVITITFTGTPALNIYLYDIILMPVDEFSYEILGGSRSNTNPLPMDEIYYDLNGLVPKTQLKSLLREIGGTSFNAIDEAQFICRPPVAVDNFKLQSKTRQRIWFLSAGLTSPTADFSYHEISLTAQSKYTPRYLALRGRD